MSPDGSTGDMNAHVSSFNADAVCQCDVTYVLPRSQVAATQSKSNLSSNWPSKTNRTGKAYL